MVVDFYICNIGIKFITFDGSEPLCASDSDCPKLHSCGKQMSNPRWGIQNFDSFGWSFLMVY
jgi:hypothetical protein